VLVDELKAREDEGVELQRNYAADNCSFRAQPACRQLQESSMVSLASSQYGLQYLVPLPT
jgi:hypothetical protein